MEARASEIARYVPAWVVSRQAGEVRPERFDAALMIADVSGFTALGRRLAADPEGAEKLWRIVNGFFGRALDLIQAWGGDVLRFAGDAPIVLWPAGPDGVAEVSRRATACALELQRTLGRYDTGEGVEVRFRVGIAVGQVLAVELGGASGRAEPLVGGAPFDQVAGALEKAGIGEVVVSASVASHLAGALLQPVATGLSKVMAYNGPADAVPMEVPSLDEAARAGLHRFVPRGVVERVEAGHAGWLGELRAVSTLFVSIDGLDYEDPDVTERLRSLVPALQRAVYRTGGSVNQFLVDDKGTVLLAAWGLPGTTHVDDPVRAVQTARDVLDALDHLGLAGSAGVSTGRVFCGVKGNRRRSEYGLLGAPVNLAARLMQRANGGVLCDRETERAARGSFAFEALSSLVLKGHDEPVPVYRPLGAEVEAPATRSVVGREAELAVVQRRLDVLRKAGSGGVVLVEGEAGIGKSVLLAELPYLAWQRGLAVARGAADAIEHRTPWYALRAVFASIVGLDSGMTHDIRRQAVQRWFDGRPELAPLAPLLNPALGVDLPETAVTGPMEGEARAERARSLALTVLGAAQPLVLAVDDLQWLDSASWDVLRFAMRELGSTLFVFASRPADAADATVREAILRAPDVALVQLGPLPPGDLARLLSQRLAVTALPAPVLAMVEERAEGHPFYAEELVLALLDEGVLQVADGVASLTPGADPAASDLPRTLDGLIAARLDLLSPVELLALKTASVIGRVFPQDMLCGLYPVDDQRLRVPQALEGVRSRDLTQIERPEPDLAYLFKHVITQQVAYGQLLFEQRRALHAAAARWYDEGRAGPRAPHLPVIAHHWRLAEDRTRAIDALEAAGEQAFATCAHREAVEFLRAAEDLDAAGRPSPDARRGRWARVIGESCSHLGRTGEGLEHLTRAVALLGQPLPSTTFAVVLALVAAGLLQVRRRWFGAPVPLEGDPTPALNAVNTLAEISLLAYYQTNVPLTLLAALRAMNLAEAWGPSPELARMKASFAHIANNLQLHGAAERYSLEALEHAEAFSHGVSTARAHQYRGALLCAYGRWSEVEPHADAAMAASRSIGHARGEEEAWNLLGYQRIWIGDYAGALAAADEMGRSGRWRDDPQVVFWAEVARAEALWQSGRATDTVELLGAIDLPAQSDATMRARGWGVLAHALLDLGRTDDALAVVEQRLLPQKRPSSFIEGRGYTAPPFVLLAAVRAGRTDLRKPAAKACAMLRTFAATFPQGRAIAACADGLRLLADGNRSRGEAQLREALALAAPARHHHDLRVIHGALGALDVPDAAAHRAEAARLLATLEN